MKKTKILLTFQENGQNGGPYHSHQRIMQSKLSEKYEFIPLIVPRFKKLIRPSIAKKFLQQIRSSGAEIVHFSGLQLEGFHVLLLAKISGKVKTVCAIRGSVKDVIQINFFERYVMSAMEKWTLKHSDVCYGVSDYVVSWELVKKYAHNCYGTIYNFFEYKPDNCICFDEMRSKIRQELNIKEDEIVVISTGRIIRDKGYEVLLRLILRDNWEKCRFVIVGNGNYKEQMFSEIEKAGKKEQVIFTGFRKDIPDLLDASDIFVTCTLHETLGNSVIEASYHKLPVVATNTGGIPEIIVHKKTGYLFDVGDDEALFNYLKMLVVDPRKRTIFGNNGRTQIESQFEKARIEAQLDSVYTTLLKQKKE